MLNFDARIKNSDAAQLRITNVKTPNGSAGKLLAYGVILSKDFHIGDARIKKLTPESKRSIGRHVEF